MFKLLPKWIDRVWRNAWNIVLHTLFECVVQLLLCPDQNQLKRFVLLFIDNKDQHYRTLFRGVKRTMATESRPMLKVSWSYFSYHQKREKECEIQFGSVETEILITTFCHKKYSELAFYVMFPFIQRKHYIF